LSLVNILPTEEAGQYHSTDMKYLEEANPQSQTAGYWLPGARNRRE
jgi:hypothetical protein